MLSMWYQACQPEVVRMAVQVPVKPGQGLAPRPLAESKGWSAMAKVNDADGNPIEIAAVVVWQVADTAQALYAVDDYTKFVAIQTETAVRHIASRYPYTSHEGDLSLRDNAEEI